MSLSEILSAYWLRIQEELLPWLRDDTMIGPLSGYHRQLVSVLGLARIEAFLPGCGKDLPGRPPSERAALARAFVAKAVFNIPTTRLLIGMLSADQTLRRLCGWRARRRGAPARSTFSRAFAAFAASALPSRLHDALIKQTHADRLVGHISRDSTAIEVREKPMRLRPAGAGSASQAQTRSSTQRRVPPHRTTPADRAPTGHAIDRDAGRFAPTLRCMPSGGNAKGHQESWIGYKLHIDSADGEIPISCVLTSRLGA